MGNDDFITVAALICEPARAKILWKLLDGKAYTASELGLYADVSPTSTSNHLSKLLKGNILKVSSQGRHRYYSFANDGVAHAVEALANLTSKRPTGTLKSNEEKKDIEYCRTCYDHLAGHVGVSIADAMVQKGYLEINDSSYSITDTGWGFLFQIGITQKDFNNSRRPLTRQCLDWSERRPHIAGQLGALLLSTALERNWFKRINFSRELVVTSNGKKALYELLGIVV